MVKKKKWTEEWNESLLLEMAAQALNYIADACNPNYYDEKQKFRKLFAVFFSVRFSLF